MQALASSAFTHGVFFDRFSDSGYHFCGNIGYNLLVFASLSKRLAFVSFVLGYYAHGQRLVGYLEDIKIPGWIQSRMFPKIGRLTAPVGYICWDFLFYVVSGIIRLDEMARPFRRLLRISLVLLSKSGHWLPTIFMVGQRQGWSGGICDAV